MEMPGRKWAASNYRYSHNGQEKESEVFAGANSAEYWMYDSRIGRRWNIDPVVDESISPYACFANSPISVNDPDGLKPNWLTKVGDFFRGVLHPNKRYVKNHHIGGGWKLNLPSIGNVFMKIQGFFRFTSKYHLRLIPQGEWRNSQINWSNPDAQGTLASGEKSEPISMAQQHNPYKDRINKMYLFIQNPDKENHSPPNALVRVTGIYKHGRDRAKYRTMFTNTGLTGFGIGDGVDIYGNWMGGGHSGYITSLPQHFLEIQKNKLKTMQNFEFDDARNLGLAAIADAINNKVFTPFRIVSALRVENIYSQRAVEYKLFIQYRQWNWQPAQGRGPLFRILHDPIRGAGKGLW